MPQPQSKSLIVILGAKTVHFTGNDLSLIEQPIQIRLIIKNGNNILGKFNQWSCWKWADDDQFTFSSSSSKEKKKGNLQALKVLKEFNFSKKILNAIKTIYL